MSPSLRGSGLKSIDDSPFASLDEVSLFTREWIEIILSTLKTHMWMSPSLRGSGLKFNFIYHLIH